MLERSYQNWSKDLVTALSKRQKDLLWSGYHATKPGGIIVYSTCTLSLKENEEVISWLIEKAKGKITIEKIDFVIPDAIPGFIHNTIRLLPSEKCEGFYIAKIRKAAR